MKGNFVTLTLCKVKRANAKSKRNILHPIILQGVKALQKTLIISITGLIDRWVTAILSYEIAIEYEYAMSQVKLEQSKDLVVSSSSNGTHNNHHEPKGNHSEREICPDGEYNATYPFGAIYNRFNDPSASVVCAYVVEWVNRISLSIVLHLTVERSTRIASVLRANILKTLTDMENTLV